MKSLSVVTRLLRAARIAHVVRNATRPALFAACLAGAALPAHAQTTLADQPLFAAANVPGNLALVLSVEFPTAVSVAYVNRIYSSANSYLGYFDPNKCYTYYYTDGTSVNNYFKPAAAASNRACNGQWSGNFLNWATMQTIDPFRWVLTGGYRVIDQTGLTVIEKAWASGQGGTSNFPDTVVYGGTLIAGATPFPSSTTALGVRIQGLGNKMRFTVPSTNGGISFQGQYYNNQTLTGTPALTRTDSAINFNWDSSQPDPSVNQSNMSVRWTGTITIPASGSYTFRARADDTVQLLVNGVSAFNQTSYNGLQNQVSPTYNFTKNQQVSIEVDFSQGYGGSSVVLEWLPPNAASYSVVGGGLGDLYGAPTAYSGGAGTGAVAYEAFVRAKVCDSSVAPLEANCATYGTSSSPTYKPEGLIQQYSNKMRFSAFGYLNDSDILRDGGVLRAQQKFVGPTQPVPGSTPVTNAVGASPGQTTGAEWDATTGVFSLNPDATDATNTASVMGLPSGSVTNSGVMNYLNKFGQAAGSYKTYDNVSELYYAAIRYFKNLSNVPEWTAVKAGTSQATVATWVDGFPVITSPPDPILYSCQRNFVLGIGDVHTWADRNVPGNTITDTVEPTMPAKVVADKSVDAVMRTNQVGVMEQLVGGASLGLIDGYGSCCTGNSALMAGLAYDAHINDIRGRTVVAPAKPQTVDTYWVDVQEGQQYEANNQFYLAAKYGGFTVPAGYSASNTTSLPLASWHTNTEGNGGNSTDASPAQPRPDHYFSGGQPAAMQAGLISAFANIAANITAFTTSFSTSLPQVAQSNNASFSSQYDSSNWTGEVTASVLDFDPSTGAPTLETPPAWTLSSKLATQLASNGWSNNRRMVTWNGSAGVAFQSSGTSKLASADLNALDTSYITGIDSTNYLSYLRGDQSNEVGASGGTQAYRKRVKLIGDIVGAQALPVGPPSFPFSDATNLGYSAFKTTWATRRTVLYVGANDGMMHAINGALLTTAPATPSTPPIEVDANAGTEMFAYVPRALFQGPNGTPNVDGLASLGNPTFVHHYMVNATPAAYDLDFAKTQGSTAKTPDWRSVLIGGLGKGGKSYFAIDITDPVGMVKGGEAGVAGKVLWEFSNSTSGMSGELGFTFGLPLVTKTAKYGWVAIFTSGYNNVDGKGYFIFVNPKTGALLEKVSTGAGTTSNDAGLAHANAFIVDASDGTADALYAGDQLGNLWRLDLTGSPSSYPAPVKIASLTDSSGKAQPVTTDPAIEIDPSTKKRVIMVGTGRLLATSDIASTSVQSFYAIFDGTNSGFAVTPPSPLSFPYSRWPASTSTLADNTNNILSGTTPTSSQAGWFEDLGVDVDTPATTNPVAAAHTGTGIAYRVISDSTTLAGSVAFAAVLPSGDPCNPSGQSRAYAQQYSNGQTTLKNAAGVTASYVSFSGTITNLRYLSVNGKPALVVGTDSGGVGQININPLANSKLRRLNWRELQSVD